MRSVIFCIFSAASCIVVFDKVLKDVGKEVVMLGKCFLEREISKFIHHGTCKWCSLSHISHILGQWLKERYLRVLSGLCGENGKILLCNVAHCIVEDEVKITLCLLVPKVGYQVLWLQAWQVWGQGCQQHHALHVTQFAVSCFPFLCCANFLSIAVFRVFDGVAKLIIQELI